MRPDPAAVGEIFRVWGGFDAMTPERSAQVGGLARKAPTASQEELLATFIDDGSGWPDMPLLVCATDCESGELRAFTKDDGVPINVACAASCSVPGLFPSVEIGGRWYTDGAVRSWTSADAVLPFAPGRVLIVAPAGIEGGAGVRGLAWRQAQSEMRLLREHAIDVCLIDFDDAARVVGQNLMDAESARLSGEAGYEHGKRIAAELGAWWRG
jgi:NTE family protein